MVTRNVSFAEGEYYHIYNRGNDKRVIYKDNSDYRRFQELLHLSNSTASINVRDIKKYHHSVYDLEQEAQLVAIGAYCLMPNHFHILLTPLIDGGVGTFLGKLSTSYSMYFNKRHDRTGGLFEGRYKARHVYNDQYLKYLYAYIHLNPVKLVDSDWKEKGITNPKKVFDYLRTYSYSSMFDYLGIVRQESVILNPTKFPDYFPTATQHQNELLDWLKMGEESYLGSP